MKKFFVFIALLLPLLATSQVYQVTANRVFAGDSLRVDDWWIKKFTRDLNTADSNSHSMLPTNRAVMDMIRSRAGGGGSADSGTFSTNYRRDTAIANVRAELGNFSSDLGPLSETKIYTPALGVASSSSLANYSHTSVDSARYKFSNTRAGISGTEYGGWLFNGTSGDSIRVTAPFWVVIGDSQAEGHPGLHGRLHTLPSGAFQWDYPDSAGQLSYHLRQLTNMRWYNGGIGGQTTAQVRARFFRDVLAQSTPGVTPSQTLTRLPQGVVIIVGINDVFNGIDPQTTKENLEWMAAVCQQYGIRCVILNLPGDEISGQTHLKKIADINLWLASGVMDQYGACVVDYNSWWNDPAYGNDNVHPTALIVDDIHPSTVGYDSLANYIYRQARLPKLIKALFINEIDPAGFADYSRPAAFTINGNAYSLSSSTELIDITTYVPDSVWLKVNSSTGGTKSGFSQIEWYVDNNPNDSVYYTKRTLYSGSTQAKQNISSLKIIDPIVRTTTATQPIVDARLNDTTLRVFQLYTAGGGGSMILNGLTNTAVLNNSVLSIYNSGGNAIGTNGSYIGTGGTNRMGNFEIRNNSAPTTTGYGVSAANTGSSLHFYGTGVQGADIFRFSTWNGASSTMTSTSQLNLFSLLNLGFQTPGAINSIGNAINIQPNINITGLQKAGTQIRGIRYSPIITSDSSTRHYGLFFVRGNNYLNIAGDSTCFGCDSAAFVNARFRVKGSFALDTVLAPPSTYNLLVHGLTDSIIYQIPSSTFTTGNTLYTGDGTVSSNRSVNLNNLNLTFNDVNTYRINADIFSLSKADGSFPYSHTIVGPSQQLWIGYTPTPGVYSKGAAAVVDTNNNISLGDALIPSTAPLYAAGGSVYIDGLQNETSYFNHVETITTNTTLTLYKFYTRIDATAGDVTITLPAASTAFGSSIGIVYKFIRIDNSGNTVTIQRAGSDTINGVTSFTLTAQWQKKEVQCSSASTWDQY